MKELYSLLVEMNNDLDNQLENQQPSERSFGQGDQDETSERAVRDVGNMEEILDKTDEILDDMDTPGVDEDDDEESEGEDSDDDGDSAGSDGQESDEDDLDDDTDGSDSYEDREDEFEGGGPEGDDGDSDKGGDDQDDDLTFDDLFGDGFQDKLEEAIDKDLDKTMDKIQDDIQSDLDTVESKEIPEGQQDVEVTPRMTAVANRLGSILRVIRSDLDNYYVDGKRTGRINMRKAMAHSKTNDPRIFKKYCPSVIDKTLIGVVILVDTSQSMSDEGVKKAMEGVWAINKAVTSLRGNKVRIIAYNTDTYDLKDWNEIGTFQARSAGYTYPDNSYRMAIESINELKKSEGVENFLLFNLTDGQWLDDSADLSEGLIAILNEMGVHTFEVFLAEGNILEKYNSAKADELYSDFTEFAEANGFRHNSQHHIVIDDLDEFPVYLERMVKEISNQIRQSL